MANDMSRVCAKDAILDAADRLIGLYGYRKTTVDDIAQEAGIGKGTVYLHFRSKEEIAISWIGRINERLRITLREIADSDGSPIDHLRNMLLTRVLTRIDATVNHSKSLDELMSSLRPSLLACRERWLRAEADIFADVIKKGRDAGILSTDEPEPAARALLQATHAFLPYSLSVKQLGERDAVAACVMKVADLLLFGLVARNSSIEENN